MTTKEPQMLATLVNASTNAVQVFALIAVILFIIAFRDKTLWATLICVGLAFLSAAVIYLA